MYEWVLVLHIVSVISWMAGLLYLPRLFVYHVDAAAGATQSNGGQDIEAAGREAERRHLLVAKAVPCSLRHA